MRQKGWRGGGEKIPSRASEEVEEGEISLCYWQAAVCLGLEMPGPQPTDPSPSVFTGTRRDAGR